MNKVLDIVGVVIGVSVEQLNEESSPENVEYWDSLKHMNLILAIEEEFKITFSDEEIMQIKKIKSIIDLLNQKGVVTE